MSIKLSDSDRDRVQAAVGRAEGQTSGEIVACLMSQSDTYGVAYLRAAVIGALVALLLALLALQSYDGWGRAWLHEVELVSALVFTAGIVAALLVRVWPGLRRLMTGKRRLKRMARLQAFRTFVEEEVFLTRERTGILIFVSAFEHRVEVLADEGINRVVDKQEWVEVVDLFVDRIKQGDIAAGFEDAIAQCGEILRQHGVEVRPDDVDELANELRVRRRPED